jgi:phosphopentomutase
MLTIHGQHHPRADIDLLYVPRKVGGRGLMQVEGTYIVETLNFVEYVESKEDPLIQIVRTHHHNTNSALLQTANKFRKSFQSETKQIKNIITQNIKGKREEKRMHGQFPCSLDEKLVDKEHSY